MISDDSTVTVVYLTMQNATPAQPVTIIEVVREPIASIDMIQVAVAAFGLTGVIMAAAVVAGLLAGAAFIWYRRRHPASTIEARGGEHNLFRHRAE
ncbi:MAG: hypothetical protein ACT4QD_23215 [Acidobacteriota bacterium]